MGSRKIVAAVLAALTLAGGALAAHGRTHAGRQGLLQAAAAYLGVSKPALAKSLRSGQTLAQVAQARGKPLDGLEAALVAALETRLDAAVAAGKLTSAQESKRLAAAPKRVHVFVTRAHVNKKSGVRVRVGLMKIAATYLGTTPRKLRAELRSGKTLAQLAQASGKSVDGLRAALLAAVKARLDAAVSAGTLDATREQALLARAQARIAKLVGGAR
jgi:hypothetical protein